MSMSFDQLTQDARKKILAELEDLNKQLSFTLSERPASSGETLELRPFSADEDRDIFATRTEEIGAAGDGSGGPAGNLDDEIRCGAGTRRRRRGGVVRGRRFRRQGRNGVRRARSTARSTSGSGSIPSTARRVTALRRCASRGRRWRGHSPPSRWWSAHPRPTPAETHSRRSNRFIYTLVTRAYDQARQRDRPRTAQWREDVCRRMCLSTRLAWICLCAWHFHRNCRTLQQGWFM